MQSIFELNYFYIESRELTQSEVKDIISSSLNKLVDVDEDYNIFINTVRNKNEELLGYSYGWVDNINIFNILVGLNMDGTERVIYEYKEEEKEEEKSLDNWGDLSDDRVKIFLPHLLDFDNKIFIQEAFSYYDDKKENSIYSINFPESLSKEFVYNFFKKFNKDDKKYYHKKEKKRDNYPFISITNKDNRRVCFIKFSHRYPHTATFVVNLVKKIKFITDEGEILCFFSQTRAK